MKTYTITSETTSPYYVKAKSHAEAIVKYMDKFWKSWFGPMLIDGKFEIYSQDGTKLKFTVSENKS